MDFRFKELNHDYYEQMILPVFCCEAMRENIVPDNCPDIARIVEVTGTVCLSTREVTGDGRICAGGTVSVSLLYIPEQGNAPQVLHYLLPFQGYGDGQVADYCELLNIQGEVQSIDARILNPRKVLTRVNICFHPVGLRHVALTLCTEPEDHVDELQLLREEHGMRVIAAVREKEFSYIEELPLSAGKNGADEIISSRASIRSADSKLIGNKLVVKGLIFVSILYREEGGQLSLLQQELPFSQILDGSGLQENWTYEACFSQLSKECRIGGENALDDRHIFTLELLTRTRVTAWREENIVFISDLYSTERAVRNQLTEFVLREDCQRVSCRQNIRELVETGTSVKTVLDSEIFAKSAVLSPDLSQLEINISLRCLYIGENDMLYSVQKEALASCPANLEGGVQAVVSSVSHGELIASILPDGIELRFVVDCAMDTWRQNRFVCISGSESLEEEDIHGRHPSLILRKVSANETLWSVAKQYRTTCRAILTANGIAEECQIPSDRLLLIPRT